ncbi:Pkinase-domain-containing protein [Athelia psychrophila]|uniref:Pkinase-domain-containing protein n=1 Tax=Athelia psychrophila TaxID=1759441 RepID=A0A166SVD3_9AGAM|nr:Pkinase-domain-containing protein [Fibularhizoctonia sp. CBS 109695]
MSRLNPHSLANNKVGHRGSTSSDNDSDETWAPRPAPEDVYDRLEDFFPEHDLDKPDIEAGSGADSPTATEQPAPPLPEKDKSDKRIGRKTKKSIRIVAEEHKKRIDRTSRADNSASVLRKRSTKLWGSRMEEVTTEQAKAEQARALSTASSPESAGVPPIFRWVRGELIWKGTYSSVYLALNATTGEMIAAKQVQTPQTPTEKADTRKAAFVKILKSANETLKDLEHPNIVQYLGSEETPNFFSIFLEYVPGGSICSCLQKHGKFEQEVTKSFTEQILTGLEYLHAKNIIHGNLKSRNVLVETSGVVKIADFANSERTENISNGTSTTMQGNVFWMAPEVIDPPKKGYNKKIDIWSLGCVVLEMWAGKRPWGGDEAMAVIWKLHKSKLPPPVPDDVTLTPLAHTFRNCCFAINPDERLTASKLRQHPYLALPSGWYFTSFGPGV